MNFNNIPKGLLAPLFFGEISVNGNVPSAVDNGGSNPPVISCDGALSIINFPFIQGNWKFYLDDFTTEVIEGGANDFTYYLNTQMSGKLTGDFDGFFWVENLDNQPHRIKMIPVAGEITPTHPLPPLDNPTFMVYEDGSLTFCLSPPITDPVVFGEIYQSPNALPVYAYLISGKTPTLVTDPSNITVTLEMEAGGEGYTLGEDQGLYKITGSFENLYSDIWFFADVNENPPAQPVVSSLTRGSDGIVQIVGSTSSQYSVVVLYGTNMNDNNPLAFAPVDESGEFSMSVALPPNFTGWVGTQRGSFVSWGAEFNIT